MRCEASRSPGRPSAHTVNRESIVSHPVKHCGRSHVGELKQSALARSALSRSRKSLVLTVALFSLRHRSYRKLRSEILQQKLEAQVKEVP